MGILRNLVRIRGIYCCVYQLKIENKLNKCFKIGFSSNMQYRLKYYPTSFKIDVIECLSGSEDDMRAFERFIHTKRQDRYTWRGRKWAGYSECYNEEIKLVEEYKEYNANKGHF